MVVLPKPNKGSEKSMYEDVMDYLPEEIDSREIRDEIIAVSTFPIETLGVPIVGVNPEADAIMAKFYDDAVEGNIQFLDSALTDLLFSYFDNIGWFEIPDISFVDFLNGISKETFLEEIKGFPVFDHVKIYPAISKFNLLYSSEDPNLYHVFSFNPEVLHNSFTRLEFTEFYELKNLFVKEKYILKPEELLSLVRRLKERLSRFYGENYKVIAKPSIGIFHHYKIPPTVSSLVYFIDWAQYWGSRGHGICSIPIFPEFKLTKELQKNYDDNETRWFS
jgi:hypothetical protein